MIPPAEKLAKKLLDNRRIFQKEITAGKIRSEQFSEEERQKIHGHCHQKIT
jgi:hypothetical protein